MSRKKSRKSARPQLLPASAARFWKPLTVGLPKREIARPLLARTAQHVTEFTGLCSLMCRIADEERNVAELQQWLSRWETVDPEDARQRELFE